MNFTDGQKMTVPFIYIFVNVREHKQHKSDVSLIAFAD